METFDLIVVGSGSGNSLPDYLADWRVALVERGTFGGTCLNVGCIPSKMFVVPADIAQTARNGSRLGVDSSVSSVDWLEIRDRVFGRIDPISAGGKKYRATGTPNVELIEGTARFTGDKTFDVDGRSISAPHVLLAAGARPVLPDIKGIDTVRTHTSDTIMRLDSLPKRLGIIGGGFIAVELGHVFSGYGSQVTMISRSDKLLRAEDVDISDRFTKTFGQKVDLKFGHTPTQLTQSGDSIVITTEKGEIEVDEVLLATGRKPNSDLLDAAAGGLTLSEDGRVLTSETMATNVEGVWAIGDLTNSYQLKHLANAEATTAFWNIKHPDQPKTVDYRAVPHAVFSNPQVASVGLTEQQARNQKIDYVVGQRDYGGTAYGWALEDTESFAKVLISPTSKQILGAHIIGPQAATLLQPLVQAMQFEQSAEAVAEHVFYIHPALTEVVENALLDGLAAIS